MKIAFFVHGYLPWDVYGVPRHIERLGSYLAERGHQVYVITVGRPNLPKVEKPKTNLNIYRTSYVDIRSKRFRSLWSLSFYTFGSMLEASRLIKKEGIQILHGHTIQYGGLQSALVSKITGKPCVITIHGSGLDLHSEKRMPQRLKFLYCADYVICQKMSAVEKLMNWGFPRKKIIFLTEGCVDIKKFKPIESKMPKNYSVITFVGRMTAFKGPHILLEAIPHILSKNPNVVVQFVGEGELKGYLVAKAKFMGVTNRVKFLGFRNDVNEILRNSDVCVSLSPYENFTDFALLEAMATGVPVVVTDVGETKAIVKNEETGLLAKCEPKDVAEKITRILDDKELAQKLSRNERELIVNEYSLEIFGKKHEEIYRRILQK